MKLSKVELRARIKAIKKEKVLADELLMTKGLSPIEDLKLSQVSVSLQSALDSLEELCMRFEPQPLRPDDFATYVGPNRPDLKNGETVRLSFRKGLQWWCANLNMPLSGSFTGYIRTEFLEQKNGR